MFAFQSCDRFPTAAPTLRWAKNTVTFMEPSKNSIESSMSAEQAYTITVREFKSLEAQGITDFQIFNSLADLFHKRGRPDISELMAEAAYRCFDRD
ncbi:hypothetical protein H6F67_17505 [Microcoleus sp. FACHB-1515]|uniref:hypothetical protein n=1 Tax=Cyanophyceae TaxID=3028117 RepID=UPI0016892987|nr:hypothetical protein [Microcoleus sp. FACHB-1515]MBD2091642.1 hypothetical protein [Microcoleus sp. FACHB-1515]